jgi:transposase
LKNNTNVMVNNTNVMVNNTNVMVNNTNVRVNNTNVMVNERITGVDLGRKDLFVSISHPNKAQCVVKEWSNGQYQFESGLAIWNSQLKRWKRKDRGIRIFEADLSDDTAIQSIISEQSMKHLHYVFEKLWIVTKFYFKRRHRRHLFWLYNRRQKALNKLCRVMAANSDIVAIGDPKFSASSRGYAPAPTVAVVKELQRLCPRKVVLIDEYNTSKLCSLCYSPLKQTKTEGRVNWRVQRCNNCGVYWNRDVNAARNMRALYVYQRDNNGARIPAFERPE